MSVPTPSPVMVMVLMAAIGIISMATAVTPEHSLPVCSPGTRLATNAGGEDVCLPCSPETFMDQYNRKRKCKSHRVCKKNEKVLFNGTSSSDVVCTCESGGRSVYNVDELYGYSCLPCQEGTIPQTVTGPFDKGDTGCCAPDSEATRDKLGKLSCLPKSPGSPSALFTTTSGPEVSTEEEMALPWWMYFGIAASVTFVIALIIIIFIVIRRRRQRGQVTNFEDGQLLPSNNPPP